VIINHQKMKKYIYTINSEINLQNIEDYRDFISCHKISEKDFTQLNELFFCLKLEYKHNNLVKANVYTENRIFREENVKTGWFSKKLKYVDTAENKIKSYQLTNKNTENYLGGLASNPDFKYPKSSFLKAPFQHIAEIDLEEFNVDFGTKKLNIVYPIFATMKMLYLDYKDANAPQIFNASSKLVIEYPFDEIDENAEPVYEKKYLEISDEVPNYQNQMLIKGAPLWIQGPFIPKSPITKKSMKFLLQIRSNKNVRVTKNAINLEEGYESYTNHLNIGGDGTLYVFYEEETKLLCLFEQIG